MSDESATRRDNALDFLDELDDRHDFLLSELERLNLRIDSVLSEYTKSRQTAVLASVEPVERPVDALAVAEASNELREAVDFD